MLFERIETRDLAHYSYIIGHNNHAVVIDPRRDADIYIEKTVKAGYRLDFILETHCYEDFLLGSMELAERTGAEIWHADSHRDYMYGEEVQDGQTWDFGEYSLEAMHTPGHTLGMISYLLRDPYGDHIMVFTGDALFAGELGRVDLLGSEKMEEMASMLHDSIFSILLPLGDDLIMCPAHGAGSICGRSIADRPYTTLGTERRLNPVLQITDRAEFIARIAHELPRPPYFRQMEVLNTEGPPILETLPLPTPLEPEAFSGPKRDVMLLDTRDHLSFCTAHIPESLHIEESSLGAHAGWFIPYNIPILLVTGGHNFENTVRGLVRLGYDNLAGHMAGGMTAWHKTGLESRSTPTISANGICGMMEDGKGPWILDLRTDEELEENGKILSAQHIDLHKLPLKIKDVPENIPVHIICDSGPRSTTGASILERAGYGNHTVVLGGFTAWSNIMCPSEEIAEAEGEEDVAENYMAVTEQPPQ